MADPICATGCAGSLPPVSFDDCAPLVKTGQIEFIYLTPVGNPLSSWDVVTEWSARLDNAAVAADAIIALRVIGDRPVPSANVIEISGKRKVRGNKDFVLNFRIDDASIENHEMVRQLECGANFLMVGYKTCEGIDMYGHPDGIPVYVSVDLTIPEDDADIVTYPGTIEWSAKFTEERIVSPI